MKRFTLRDRLIGVAVLVALAGVVPSLIEWMVATRAAIVQTDTRAVASAQSTRRAVSIAANEAAVLEDIHKVIAGQAAYRAVNHGFYDGRLGCLVSPKQCILFYPPNAPTFLDSRLATLANDSGYRRSFTAGPSPPLVPSDASASSVTTYRYDAWPSLVGHSGVRAFAADATGRICFASEGTPVIQVSKGKLEPSCTSLELFEPKRPSNAPTAPPTAP